MSRGHTIDRVQLHCTLYERADRFGKLEIYQKALAEQLQVTQATMSLIIKELVQEGRIKKVASRPQNVGVYVIRPPAAFEHEFDPYHVPGIDIERCKLCGGILEGGPHLRTYP